MRSGRSTYGATPWWLVLVRSSLQRIEFNIQLDNQPISRVEYAKSLGLIIDDRLSWSNYIKELCRKISSAIGALRRIRSLISNSQSTAVQIYNALIQPHFYYCATVWDGLCSYEWENTKIAKPSN